MSKWFQIHKVTKLKQKTHLVFIMTLHKSLPSVGSLLCANNPERFCFYKKGLKFFNFFHLDRLLHLAFSSDFSLFVSSLLLPLLLLLLSPPIIYLGPSFASIEFTLYINSACSILLTMGLILFTFSTSLLTVFLSLQII